MAPQARRLARPIASAVAIALLAGLLASVPPGTGHSTVTAGESPGNPAGLAGIVFKGPPGTSIENSVCPPIADADRPIYYDGPQHIAHINAVIDLLAPSPLENYIVQGSVDLWHLEDYEDPAAIEGPHDPVNVGSSVMLGSDGFFRGQMARALGITDEPGDELRIQDVHTKRTYCIYGAPNHDGPFLFIHSTWGDPQGMQPYTLMDLADFYVPLYNTWYPGSTPVMTHIFAVASAFNDEPLPQVDFTCDNLDPNDYDMAPGVQFVGVPDMPGGSFSWNYGDGSPAGSGDSPTHVYADDGDYVVTLTYTLAGNTATATHVCTAVNRPPTAFFFCPLPETNYVTFVSTSSSDPEGPIATSEWTFGDGSPTEMGAQVNHLYPGAGIYTVTLTVQDNDWNSPLATRAVTSDTFTRDCDIAAPPNHPPVMEPPPRPTVASGTTVQYEVQGYDPDGDPLTYSVDGLPEGATFDPNTRTFSWATGRPGLYGPFWFRVTDPYGLSDAKQGWVLVFVETSDVDLDGIPDSADVCPSVADRPQADADRDGIGDGCDEGSTDAVVSAAATRRDLTFAIDTDKDGVVDAADNCAAVPNRDQADLDGDSSGDLCDRDLDGDGVPDQPVPEAPGAALDNCPITANADQLDLNGDGVGDACDPLMGGATASTGGSPRERAAPVGSPEPLPAAWSSTAGKIGIGMLALALTALVVFGLLGRRLRGSE